MPSTRTDNQEELMQTEFEYNLEEYIDEYGVLAVLKAIVGVCTDKADHLIVNWQDAVQAKVWTCLAAKLDRIACEGL